MACGECDEGCTSTHCEEGDAFTPIHSPTMQTPNPKGEPMYLTRRGFGDQGSALAYRADMAWESPLKIIGVGDQEWSLHKLSINKEVQTCLSRIMLEGISI